MDTPYTGYKPRAEQALAEIGAARTGATAAIKAAATATRNN